MRIRLFVLAIVLLLGGPYTGADAQPASTTIRIVSWNVKDCLKVSDVEARADDYRMLEMLVAIEDGDTRHEATAERAFLEKIGGGCSLPVGAYARCWEKNLLLTIYMGSQDGEKSFTAKIEGLKHDPLQLASDAYLALVERGGAELLRAARNS